MDKRPVNLEGDLLASLVALITAWSSHHTQGRIAAEVGVVIHEADVRALYTLGRLGGEARPMRLAAAIEVTRPTMSKMLARLVEAGLIERSLSEGDARGALISLSSAGAAAYDRLVESGLRMVNAALADVTPMQVAGLSHVIDKLVDTLPGPDYGSFDVINLPRDPSRK